MPTSSIVASTDLDRADELRHVLTRRLDEGELDLPLLPHVANQVLTLAHDPNADAGKLATLIQQDQALAAQILRIANSPAYLPRSPIVSLQQAIAWLGLNMLAGIAFSVSLQSGVFKIVGYEREVQLLWRHALATGLYGKEIARRLRHNVENAFLCGLLHTIGKPLILHVLVSDRQRSMRLPWSVLEPLINEFHIPAGVRLAEAWALPDPVQETIRFYQDDRYHEARSPTKGAVITCLADHLATFLLDPAEMEEDALRALPVIRDLNLYPEDLTALLDLADTVRPSVECLIV
ncbi:MAG: HDOD domain-containing protein [Nitrospirae bacterium]|nr:MAG: HDOD domain-containing protein [Nitrospirota bacterium]